MEYSSPYCDVINYLRITWLKELEMWPAVFWGCTCETSNEKMIPFVEFTHSIWLPLHDVLGLPFTFKAWDQLVTIPWWSVVFAQHSHLVIQSTIDTININVKMLYPTPHQYVNLLLVRSFPSSFSMCHIFDRNAWQRASQRLERVVETELFVCQRTVRSKIHHWSSQKALVSTNDIYLHRFFTCWYSTA